VLRLCCALFWGWRVDRLPTERNREEFREAVTVLEQWAETGIDPPDFAKWASKFAFFNPRPEDEFFQMLGAPAEWEGEYRQGATKRLAWALRELFGNPFRPVTFAPDWRTDTAVTLARQMYESRDFSLMPILADALQDADCDNDDILSHCRDTKATHVRGCWVVDLVLGKE